MKKALLIALSLLMIIGLFTALPLSASAVTIDSKSDFFTALMDPSLAEVRLGADIEITNDDDTINNYIALDGIDRTIDLNGHTLSSSRRLASEASLNVVNKTSGTKLTITNSSSEGGIDSVSPHSLIGVETSVNDFSLKISNLNVTTVAGSHTFFRGNSNVSSTNSISIENSSFSVSGSGNKAFISSAYKNISIKNTRFVKDKTYTHLDIIDGANSVKAVDVLDEGDAIYYGEIKASYDEETLLNQIYLYNSNVMEIIIKEEAPSVDSVYVSDLSEFVSAAGDILTKRVILNADLTVPETVAIEINGLDRVLELNGHTITLTNSAQLKIAYNSGNKFTIDDSSGEGTGTIISDGTGPIYAVNYMYGSDVVTLVINGGNYNIRSFKNVILACNCLKMIINGGVYNIGAYSHLFYSNYGGTVELNRMTINCADNYNYAIHEGSFASSVASDLMPEGAKLIYTASDGTETDVSSETIGKTYAGNSSLSVVVESAPIQYTVVFHSNGAQSIPSQTVTEGRTASEPVPPTKNYYTFGGWYFDSELTVPYDFSTAVTADLDLYAKWTETNHRWNVTETVYQTCTEGGLTVEVCLTCGEERRTTSEPLGHDWGDWTVEKNVTCGEDGVEKRVCARAASHVETRTIPATGDHNWVLSSVITLAGCLVNGGGEYACSVCGATKTDIIPALGHDYVDHDAKAPNCTETGWEAYQTCSRCDYTTYVEKAAKGHSPAAEVRENEVIPTCSKAGSYDSVVYCSVCGVEISRESKTIAKKAHTYKNVVTPATLTKDGKIVPTCSVCGVKKAATAIAKASGIKISKAKFVYNGKVQKPTLTVKDSAGKTIASKCYTATWSNSGSKAAGTYTVKVTLKGNYSGTQKLKYTIAPRQVTGLKAATVKKDSIKVTWTKLAEAKAFKVEYSADGKTWTSKVVTTNSFTLSKLKSGAKWQFRVTALSAAKKGVEGKASAVLKTGTVTAAPKISKLTSTKAKTATVTWSKVTGAKSYTVYTSTDGKTFKAVKTGVTKTTYTITGLKAGKKVYVKIQAVNAYGAKSAQSAAKSVTVKK